MRGPRLDLGRSTSLCSRSDVTDFTTDVTDFTTDSGKALDARSKARLGQEYVVMLKTLVARDKTQKLLDKKAVRQ